MGMRLVSADHVSSDLKKKKFIYLFIWLYQVLVVTHAIFSCSIWDPVPWPGIELRPRVLGVHRVLAPGPQGTSTLYILKSRLKKAKRIAKPNFYGNLLVHAFSVDVGSLESATIPFWKYEVLGRGNERSLLGGCRLKWCNPSPLSWGKIYRLLLPLLKCR